MTSMDAIGVPDRGQDDLHEHLLDGDLTIYDPRSRRAVFLNRTATATWGCADGGRSDGQIAAILAEQFDQDIDSITSQVSQLLDELDDLELLEQREPPRRRR